MGSLSASQSATSTFSAEKSKYCACSRVFFDLRAPEKLSFGRQQLIYARFSLLRFEPVPLRIAQGA
jgi:hypothetical protein